MNFTNESPMTFNCVVPEFVSLFFAADVVLAASRTYRVFPVVLTVFMFLLALNLLIRNEERTTFRYFIEFCTKCKGTLVGNMAMKLNATSLGSEINYSD